MKQIIWIVLATFGMAFLGCRGTENQEFGPSGPVLSVEVQDAIAVLEESPWFAVGGIGFGGDIPITVLAFRAVLASDHARILFARITSNASLPGQMYGLSGLYLVDREEFLERVEAYSGLTELVLAPSGCVWMQYPANELVELISQGDMPQQLEQGR